MDELPPHPLLGSTVIAALEKWEDYLAEENGDGRNLGDGLREKGDTTMCAMDTNYSNSRGYCVVATRGGASTTRGVLLLDS